MFGNQQKDDDCYDEAVKWLLKWNHFLCADCGDELFSLTLSLGCKIEIWRVTYLLELESGVRTNFINAGPRKKRLEVTVERMYEMELDSPDSIRFSFRYPCSPMEEQTASTKDATGRCLWWRPIKNEQGWKDLKRSKRVCVRIAPATYPHFSVLQGLDIIKWSHRQNKL